MTHELFDQMQDAGKVSFEMLRRLGEIQSRTLDRMTEVQFNFVSLGLDCTMEQARRLGSMHRYQDLLTAPSEFASNYGSRLMSIGLETVDALSGTTEELSDLVHSSFEPARPTVTAQERSKAKRPAKRGAGRSKKVA
jgi:hypothetical protein